MARVRTCLAVVRDPRLGEVEEDLLALHLGVVDRNVRTLLAEVLAQRDGWRLALR